MTTQNTKQKDKRLVAENFSLLRDMRYERKTPFSHITTSVNFNQLGVNKQNAILTLTMVETDEDAFDYIFPKSLTYVEHGNEYIYLVKTEGKIFLVNNEGYRYCRYALELRGLPMDKYNECQTYFEEN